MRRFTVRFLSFAIALTWGTLSFAQAQDATTEKTPADTAPGAPLLLPGDDSDAAVKPLAEGPVHEAFLSPAKNEEPDHVTKTPPQPIVERPGVESPSPKAHWIEGYWDWDPTRNDFTWVTGTWRVPPPGRFWVNGYWKRDDKGWFRVPGFWSDRQTDRIDYKKDGPPKEHPNDDPGPSPGEDFFYVPGQYVPDANGVAWQKGFWAKAQPGWAWVPSQWVKQPEGYVFQEGYWDRVLEDRGTLFSPAAVTNGVGGAPLTYSPIAQISPQSYARLYGAFGRPTSFYDGYPGCYYDPNGLYYGYANYGNIGLYTGYLDYPFVGSFGYPYLTTAGYGYPFGGYGYGGFGGFGYGGFGGLSRLLFGYGYGFPYLAYNYGFPYLNSFGYGYPFGGYGYGYPFGGYGFGYPFGGYGFGFGSFGFGGFGFPFFGGFGFPFFGGLGFGGSGRGNYGHNFHHHQPFFPGNHNGHHGQGNHNSGWVNNGGSMGRPGQNGAGTHHPGGSMGGVTGHHGPMAGGGMGHPGAHHGITPPASRSAFGNPLVSGGRRGGTAHATGPLAHSTTGGFNGGHASHTQHVAARPAFNAHNALGTHNQGITNAIHSRPLGAQHAGALGNAGLNGANQLGVHHAGANGGFNGGLLNGANRPGIQQHHAAGLNGGALATHHAAAGGALNGAAGLQQHAGALGAGGLRQNHAGGGAINGLQWSPTRNAPSLMGHNAVGGTGGFYVPQHAATGGLASTHHLGGVGSSNALGSGFAGAGHIGGLNAGHMGGMNPGFMGGFNPGHMGGFNPGHMGGMSAGHMGGFSGGHMGGFSGGHMGGFSGGHMGGMGGGFGGGMGHAGGGGHMGGHH